MLGVENMSLSQLAGIHLASLSYGQWEYLKKALVAKAEQLLRENAPYVEYVPVDLVPYLEAEGKMSQEEKKKLRDTDRAYSRACEFKEYLDAFGPKNPFSGKGGLDALGFMLAHDLPPNPSGSGSKTNATPAPSQPPKGGVSQDTPSWTAPKDKQTENKNEPEDEVHVPEEYAPALTTPANPPEGEVSKAGSNQTFSVPGPSVSNASTTVSATTTPSASSSQGGTPFNVSATITEASGTYTVNQSGVLTANANGSATNSNVVTTVTSGAASPPGAAGASAKPMLATPKPAKTPPKSGTPASTNPAEKSVVAPTAEPPAASGVPGG
jgi:hypothetical protein